MTGHEASRDAINHGGWLPARALARVPANGLVRCPARWLRLPGVV